MPGVLASEEAKAGGLLKPRSSRLRWTVITPLHFSLDDRAESCSVTQLKCSGTISAHRNLCRLSSSDSPALAS
ncbi:hypothetical protein AAY473_031306 [Plecturocebus cupreus]